MGDTEDQGAAELGQIARELLASATVAQTSARDLVCVGIDDTTVTVLVGPRFTGRAPRRLESPFTAAHSVDLGGLEDEAVTHMLVPVLAQALATPPLRATSAPAFAMIYDRDLYDLTTDVVLAALDQAPELRDRYRSTLLGSCMVRGDLTGAEALLAAGASFSEPMVTATANLTPWLALVTSRAKAQERARQGLDEVEAPSIEALRFALARGVDLEARTSRAETALHLACSEVDLPWVTALLDAGADANARAKHESCLNAVLALPWNPQATEVATLLLEHDAAVDAPDDGRWGRTALHVAAEHGLEALLARLVAAGANVTAADTQGVTPLALALSKSHLGCALKLMDAGATASAGNNGLAQALTAYRAGDRVAFVAACDAMDARPIGAAALLAVADSLGAQREGLKWAERWLLDFEPELFAASARLALASAASLDRLRALWRASAIHLTRSEDEPADGLAELAFAYLRAGARREALLDLGLALDRRSNGDNACLVASALVLATNGCVEPARVRLQMLVDTGVDPASCAPSDLLSRLEALGPSGDDDTSHYPDDVLVSELAARRARADNPDIVTHGPAADALTTLARDLGDTLERLASELPEDETLGAILLEWGGESTQPYGSDAMATGYASWGIIHGQLRLGGQCIDSTGNVDLASLVDESADPESLRLDIAYALRLAWLEALRSPVLATIRVREPLLLAVQEHEQEPIMVWSSGQ